MISVREGKQILLKMIENESNLKSKHPMTTETIHVETGTTMAKVKVQ